MSRSTKKKKHNKKQLKTQTKSKPRKKRGREKIIWALDPFENEGETRSHVQAVLKLLSRSDTLTIEPTYVMSPSEFDLNFAFSQAWTREYRDSAKKILDQTQKDAGLPHTLPSKVLVERLPSLSKAVESLLHYAQKSNAKLIAVGTHARKGLFRVLLGSFAETLLLRSRTPLLIVGPHAHNHELNHILFATDLGEHSLFLFENVLDLAETLGAKITIFHAIAHPIEPVVQSSVFLLSGSWVGLPDFLSKKESEKRKTAEKYVALAHKRKVRADVVIDSSHLGISSLILKNAERHKANLIAMAAESGAVSATLVGSITRQVVREAPCPVWVLHI